MRPSLIKTPRATLCSPVKRPSVPIRRTVENSPRVIPPPILPQTYLSDPECIEMRERMLENGDMKPYDNIQLTKLFSHLREYSQNVAMQHQYELAQRTKDLSQMVHDELLYRTSDKSRHKQKTVREMRKRLEEREKTEDAKDEHMLAKYDQETEARRQQILVMHKEEQDAFINLWTNVMPRKYRKPSQQLLELMQRERSSAMINEFEKAESLNREIEELSRQESEQAQAQLKKDYLVAKRKLEEKQRVVLERFDDGRRKQRSILENQSEQRRIALAARKNVLLQQKKTARPMPPVHSAEIDFQSSIRSTIRQKTKPHNVLLPPLDPPTEPVNI